MASGSLPKSPVSSSLCDEVPHVFIRKTHLQPREFLISSGKGLLQHNLPGPDIRTLLTTTRFDRTHRSATNRRPQRLYNGRLRNPGQLRRPPQPYRSEEHTSELQSHSDLVCR